MGANVRLRHPLVTIDYPRADALAASLVVGLRDGARLPMSREPVVVRVACGAASNRPD